MKIKNILSYLFSTRLMSITILLYAFTMASATFIENDYGTPTAKALIYNTKWFELLMLLLVINFIGNVFKYKLFRKEKWPVFLFHIAFIIILLGSFTSRYFGFEGMMLIREGEVSNTILSDKIYITARVDNNKYMKTYGKNDDVLFSQLGSNSYSISDKFGKDGEEKTPFSIELIDYIANAKESITKDPQGDRYLHIVESSQGARNDIFLKEGDIKVINNIIFSFNNALDGAMNITVNDKESTIKPLFDGTYMEMKSQKLTPILKDSISNLQIKKLYTFNNLRFVINNVVKGKLVSQTASKKEKSNYPLDAVVLKVKVGNEEKNIVVKGSKFLIDKPLKVKVGNLNFYIAYGSKKIETPFSIKLRDFELERYPGTNSPSSYASEVTVIDKNKIFDQRIYMNHVLDYKGYRFFQSSYDPDEKGTHLSVNHDFAGTLLTYIGYILMGIGMFFSLFLRGSHFKVLSDKLKKLSNKKAASLSILFIAFSFMMATAQENHSKHNHNKELTAQELQKQAVSKEHASKFGRLVIQDFRGRMKPVNTYALEALRKIHKTDTYKGLTAEQILLTAQVNPRLLSFEPIIKVNTVQLGSGSKIEKDLGIKDNHTTMMNFFKNGSYYLEKLAIESSRKEKANQTSLDKEIINLDERASIWYRVLEGDLLTIYPKFGDKDNKWYSGVDSRAFVAQDTMVLKMHSLYLKSLAYAIKTNDYKQADEYLEIISKYQNKLSSDIMPTKKIIDLEIKYNNYNIFFKLLIFYSLLGFILLFLTFIDLFKPNNKWIGRLMNVFIGITVLGVLAHTFGIALRWYITKHAPWSNSYEATVFIAWVLLMIGLLLTHKRSKFIISGAVLFAGFLLGIAHGNLMSPEMTNLEPVLKSYWLMIHVGIITASYGFLGLGSLLGFFVLLLFLIRTPENKAKLKDTINELTYINEMTITVGLYMLSIGTFLGGVWASESWGRYWSWDPKEVWALISMMIYIFILHMRLVPGLKGKFAFNFASMVSISTLIMTYFGVNYYLSGMHSYGKGDPVPIPDWIYYFIVFIIIFSIFSYRKYKKVK